MKYIKVHFNLDDTSYGDIFLVVDDVKDIDDKLKSLFNVPIKGYCYTVLINKFIQQKLF